jgi:DNA polymerase-3 subunit delta'
MSVPSDGAAALLGQAEAERILARDWQSGRLHHAWLLTGPVGIGKATLARRFAKTVLTGAAPEAAARRVAAGTHPDLLLVTRAIDEKRQRLRPEMVLDDVRPIGGFLHRTAAEGGWRVVIVDDADHLNRHAANAVLKLLEEPPAKALLLLVSSAPGRLLPTIRSRCRTLRLAPLDESTMHRVLCRLLPGLSLAERQTLIELSDGSPGTALALSADDGIALSRLVEDVLFWHGTRPALWSYELADAVLRRNNGFSTFIGLLSAAISTTIRMAARNDRDARAAARDGGDARADLLTSRAPEAWAEICEELVQLREETESLNLDKRQALLAGLSLLSR